jgi:hypothetical protein
MTTLEVGKKLVEMCSAGKMDDAAEELYSADISSLEAGGPPGQSREVQGMKGIRAKGQWWTENHIVHSSSVEGPWPCDNQFIVKFKFDITHKPTNKRFVMEEAALYTVQNGKIVAEKFFYAM